MSAAIQELAKEGASAKPLVKEQVIEPITFAEPPIPSVIVFDGNLQNQPPQEIKWRTSPPVAGENIFIDRSCPPMDKNRGLSDEALRRLSEEYDDGVRRGVPKEISARSLDEETDVFEVQEGNEGSDVEVIRKND